MKNKILNDVPSITLNEAERKYKFSRDALKRMAKLVPGAYKDSRGWHLPSNIIIAKDRIGLKFSFPESDSFSPTSQKFSDSTPKLSSGESLANSEVLEMGLRAFLEKIGVDGLLALPKAKQALGHALIQEIWETVKT